MADNVNITPGSGNIIAADEVVDGTLGTVKVQYTKIMDATLGSTNKLIITAAGAAKVDGSVFFPTIGSPVPSTGVYQAGQAQTSLPAAATAGNLTGILEDKFGRPIVVLGTLRNLRKTQNTVITASTSPVTIISAGSAGIFNDLVMITIANSASSATLVTIGDGSTNYILFSPAQSTIGFAIPGSSIPASSSATAWTATCGTSVSSIYITTVYEQNQ